MMPSLGFALLDQHVVAGLADDPAVEGPGLDAATPPATFARVLEHAAAVAGGLAALGVRAGDVVAMDLPVGLDRVVVVCACLRLGAMPVADASQAADATVGVRETGGSAEVTVPEGEPIALTTLRKAGASDPAMALPRDAEGFRAAASEAFPDVVDALLAGRPVRVD